jgi:hypothetical protein
MDKLSESVTERLTIERMQALGYSVTHAPELPPMASIRKNLRNTLLHKLMSGKVRVV